MLPRELGLLALFSLPICFLCNVLSLFFKPRKWQEGLLFLQFVLFAAVFFIPQDFFRRHWVLLVFGYPVLFVLLQVFLAVMFFLFYKRSKQEKFLYLALSAIISGLSLAYICFGVGFAMML